MPLVDARGRSLGAIHAFDAIAVMLAVIAGVCLVAGYGLLEFSRTSVASADPSTLVAGRPTRVRLQGSGFRPFLQAYIAPAGTAFILADARVQADATAFFLVDGSAADVELPSLAAGTYDLHLYDRGREVGSSRALIHVGAATPPRATVEATVRLFVPRAARSLVRPGDQDQHGATVRQVNVLPKATPILEVQKLESNEYSGAWTDRLAADVELAIPLEQTDAKGWTYDGRPIRAGDAFRFATDRYQSHGLVLSVSGRKLVAWSQ